MELRIDDNREDLAKSFSEYFSEVVDRSDSIHIALSGGSTPKIVFQELAGNFNDKISWEKVHFYWGDERCVPPDDKESNYLMTKEYLFSKVNIPDFNIHRIKGENDPDKEALEYGTILDKNLPKSEGIPQFDIVLLGMGDDGHTASIFPHEIDLWHATHNCVVGQHPDTGQKRITISGKIINNAVEVIFLVTGKGKADKVRQVVLKEGNFKAYPASLVAPKSGKLIWYLDRDAAAGLNR